jgi:hypothetical protein
VKRECSIECVKAIDLPIEAGVTTVVLPTTSPAVPRSLESIDAPVVVRLRIAQTFESAA